LPSSGSSLEARPDVAEPGSRIQLPGPWGCHPHAHAGALKRTDQSSSRRVLPLNYRAAEEAQTRFELASDGVVRPRSVRRSAAMLRLERESEIDRGRRFGEPRLQAELQCQLALLTRTGPQSGPRPVAHPRARTRGRSWCRRVV